MSTSQCQIRGIENPITVNPTPKKKTAFFDKNLLFLYTLKPDTGTRMDLGEKKRLKEFIFEASRATYASGNASLEEKESDGSTTIRYEKGVYKFHDNFFGGNPYGGREVVFLNGKPLWIMVYYGSVLPDVNHKDVYAFLITALSKSVRDTPYRGPASFKKAAWRYESAVNGEIGKFYGSEKIFRDDACVYEGEYLGGYIDRQNP